MKQLLLTTIAAVVLVGCGPSVDIHKAAREGNIETVKRAIADGVDVKVKDLVSSDHRVPGVTPLRYASQNGHKEICDLLLANGADVNASGDGWAPLPLAAHNGYKEVVVLLITKGADVNAKVRDGSTALHKAAMFGHREIVELLIAEGADVDAKDDGNWTPLNMAAHNGYKEVVELLINNGADVNTKGYLGNTPLSGAIRFKEKETAALLRKHGAKTREELHVLLDVAKKGDIEAVKQHLAAGADVNEKNEWGGTPLHIAAGRGHKEVVELLIANGAEVDAIIERHHEKNEWCGTPLHNAAGGGHKEIVELLIAKGAEVDAIIVSGRNQGKTPLDMAISSNHPETANLLRKHGGKTGEELKAEGK
jgi:ankyrin repeat protein